MTNILHIEDDEDLAQAVKSSFEAFGFRGNIRRAPTLADAARILETWQPLDLVISDMELPDGTGLDVVKLIRASAARAHIPILILSGHTDHETINRAYALGVNAYVPKVTHDRTTIQIVRGIYDHWLRDVRLPHAPGHGRTDGLLSWAISIRVRVAQAYMAIADRFGSAETAFWMGIAQRDGNLANLMVFLRSQLGDRQLPDDVLHDLGAHQRDLLHVLDEMSARPPNTEDDAFRYLLALSAPVETPAYVRSVGLLFPATPLAVASLLEAQAINFELVAAQIEQRSSDPELRAGASRLRGQAEMLRSLASQPKQSG
ncbi:MAG TPA: response regulator [Kofleriaceae bacterium]|nr:response regulator [Kofleriaceae bacterium]